MAFAVAVQNVLAVNALQTSFVQTELVRDQLGNSTDSGVPNRRWNNWPKLDISKYILPASFSAKDNAQEKMRHVQMLEAKQEKMRR